MNNLTKVCFVRYLVIVVVSMGLGGAKRCGGDFKVIILTGRGQATKRGQIFMGGVDLSTQYEGGSHYVILLF